MWPELPACTDAGVHLYSRVRVRLANGSASARDAYMLKGLQEGPARKAMPALSATPSPRVARSSAFVRTSISVQSVLRVPRLLRM